MSLTDADFDKTSNNPTNNMNNIVHALNKITLHWNEVPLGRLKIVERLSLREGKCILRLQQTRAGLILDEFTAWAPPRVIKQLTSDIEHLQVNRQRCGFYGDDGNVLQC